MKEYGAVKVMECWGDEVPSGKLTSFPLAVKCKKDETVVLSWIEWPTKAARNKGMKKYMSDPRMMTIDIPADGSRMIFGGFKMVLCE